MENVKETKNYYTTPINFTDHTRFGGNICASDFCTDYKGTRNIASRIVSDWNFDAQCRKNIKSRNEGKEHA